MKHDHAYSKHFRDDISPEKAYNYFHARPLDPDEFRCDENCPVPVTLVNVRSTPDKWKVPPYFKYRSGYDGKHSNLCPNISKITKVSKHSTHHRVAQTYKPSEDVIINLSTSNPTSYEDVGTFQQASSAGETRRSYQSDFEFPAVKHRSTRLSKLSSTVNRFHSHPNDIVNFNGTAAPLSTFFQELRYGHYQLSLDKKIYHGKAFAKKVKNKNGKELLLLEFDQKCQLENVYFEKPAVFIEADVLTDTSQQHRKLLKYCESGEAFHLYVWGSFFVTSNSKIRVYKTNKSDDILLKNLYFEDWSE
ncbi:TPA: hypothetical protein U9G18_001009 [Streptococcus agalactiae]|uniref:hypothetical protein n=1 Tax=Streptococcus anginosus TaxID=1328 RepID=UPI002ABC0AE1|nr:hypothetical protein [Streptococcus agalactiae]HEN9135937.1 hypothetical protein [Streptococcus agalactiae]HEO4923543.1 hypothetical protein [Streptococcus agalactiae]HEO8335376.1 hypothetical protein [Streptococcus agalactiae]